MSMSKRLQVVITEEELDRFRVWAESQGLTLSEWARQALRAAHQNQLGPSPARKLQALDRALRCQYPTDEIAGLLTEIEAGRGLR